MPDNDTSVPTGGPAAAVEPPQQRRRNPTLRRWLVAGAFLAPALIILGALVVYPIFFSTWRSLFDRTGVSFVGLSNYTHVFTDPRSLVMLRNNLIWVVFAPTVVTALGLVYAVLTEKVRWATVFKVVVFMPMAISMLAAGVIFRLAYEGDPDRGLANAVARSVVDTFRSPGPYQGGRPSVEDEMSPVGHGYAHTGEFRPGDTAHLGLIAIPPGNVPEEAEPASDPQPQPEAITGVVWLDFTPGTGGERGAIDPGERGLPGATVEAVRDGRVVASASSDSDGLFVLEGLDEGAYQLRLGEATFRPAFPGIAWLGPSLVTPSIIVSFVWMWTGFAMVIIGAGLASINREVLEAARVDGASEWQVFRHVTVPMLSPVLVVVLVTLVINVLKIFDLVAVVAPGAVQDNANVIAVEMWRVAFGGRPNPGLGSALAILLFLLVIPAMLFNIKRFRAE